MGTDDTPASPLKTAAAAGLATVGEGQSDFVLVQPRATASKGTKRVAKRLRAIKELTDAESSKTTPDDPFVEWYRAGGAKNPIQPKYDLDYLARLSESTSVLGPIIDAMATNVAGHGVRLAVRDEITPEERERLADEIARERTQLRQRLDNIHAKHSLGKIREIMRRRLEKVGYSAFEIVADGDGAPALLEPIRPQFLRYCPVDPEMVDWSQPTYDVDKLAWTERKLKRQFRLYSFAKAGSKAQCYLKEFGDPRVLDRETGEFYDAERVTLQSDGTYRIPGDARKVIRPANEVLLVELNNDTGVYPLPRYVGSIAEATLSWYANQHNIARLENPIPPMIVAVSGGTFTPEAKENIAEMFEEAQDIANVGAPLILEATMSAEMASAQMAGIGGTSTVKIEVHPLERVMSTDGLYREMDAANRKKLRACWKLSPVATGESDDFTRAAAQAGRSHDETDVYEPERQSEDLLLFDKALLPRWGIRFHRVITNPSPALGDEDLPELLKEAREGGAITPEEERQIVARRIRVDLEPLEGDIFQVPVALWPLGVRSLEDLDALEPLVDAQEREAEQAAAMAEAAAGGAEGESTGEDSDGDDVDDATKAIRARKALREEALGRKTMRLVRDLNRTITAAVDTMTPRHDAE